METSRDRALETDVGITETGILNMELTYTPQELEKVTRLIQILEDWIAQHSEEEIRDQTNKSGAEFFKYLVTRGYAGGEISNRVYRILGYRPNVIATVADAETVLAALRLYEYTLIQAKNTGLPLEQILKQQGL